MEASGQLHARAALPSTLNIIRVSFWYKTRFRRLTQVPSSGNYLDHTLLSSFISSWVIHTCYEIMFPSQVGSINFPVNESRANFSNMFSLPKRKDGTCPLYYFRCVKCVCRCIDFLHPLFLRDVTD